MLRSCCDIDDVAVWQAMKHVEVSKGDMIEACIGYSLWCIQALVAHQASLVLVCAAGGAGKSHSPHLKHDDGK